jgi:protein-S-isoprenylcysteine O-methyltransferase Ste14
MKTDLFVLVFLVGLVIGATIRAMARAQLRRRGMAQPYQVNLLDALLVGLSSLGLFVLPLVYIFSAALDFANYQLPTWAGIFGAVLYTWAIWLLWRSHADLGANFSLTMETRQKQQLVTQGVYQFMRHPMYAAHWLWALALPFLLTNWIAGFGLLVTFLPLYLYRAPREEHKLEAQFGDEYRAYINRTGRVIPRLRRL